jgi:hypothetical protein
MVWVGSPVVIDAFEPGEPLIEFAGGGEGRAASGMSGHLDAGRQQRRHAIHEEFGEPFELIGCQVVEVVIAAGRRRIGPTAPSPDSGDGTATPGCGRSPGRDRRRARRSRRRRVMVLVGPGAAVAPSPPQSRGGTAAKRIWPPSTLCSTPARTTDHRRRRRGRLLARPRRDRRQHIGRPRTGRGELPMAHDAAVTGRHESPGDRGHAGPRRAKRHWSDPRAARWILTRKFRMTDRPS